MAFEDPEGAKVPTAKLIAPIATHYSKSTIAPAMKLVCLQPSLQQKHWSKTFVLSLWEATLTWLHHATNNVVHRRSNNNSDCVHTSGTWRLH
jgi:hypothetical protein